LSTKQTQLYNSLIGVLRDIPILEDILTSSGNKLTKEKLMQKLTKRNSNLQWLNQYSKENLQNEVDLVFSILDTTKDGYLSFEERLDVLSGKSTGFRL